MVRSDITIEKTSDAHNNYLFKRRLSKGKYFKMTIYIKDKIKIDKCVLDIIVDYIKTDNIFNNKYFCLTLTVYSNFRYGIINVKLENTEE